MTLSDLVARMDPPADPVDPEGSWPAVEAALGTPLPQEYKHFIGTYGSGSINGFLSILNPFARDEDLNLLRQVEVARRDAERVRDRFAALAVRTPLLYSLFPARGGFLPWGKARRSRSAGPREGSVQWCDWVTSDAPPDAWVAAVRIENGYASFGAPFAAFLLGVLDDRYGVFPEMEPWPEPVFVPSGTEPPARRKRRKAGRATPAPALPRQSASDGPPPPVGTMTPRKLPAALSVAFPDLEARTAVRLNPQPASTAIEASKLGGDLLWPDGERWPRCPDHDITLAAILQLRAADVPELGFPSATDLFQLLWCPEDHDDHGFGPRAQATWRTAGDVTAVQATPVPLAHLPGYMPRECRVAPDRAEELAALWSDEDPRCAPLDAWLRDHWDQLWPPGAVRPPRATGEEPYVGEVAASPVSKVGGHPAWIHGPERRSCSCGREMEHLLTIASSEDDPSGWRAARLDGPASRPASTGLLLGDVGRVYVFVCRRCDGWPVDSVLQMT